VFISGRRNVVDSSCGGNEQPPDIENAKNIADYNHTPRSKSYQENLLKALEDPFEAQAYLNAALKMTILTCSASPEGCC